MSIEWITVIAGAISAASWFASVIVTPDLSISYYGQPPRRFRIRAKIGTVLNASGALFAAIAIGSQAYSTYTAML